MNYNYEFDKEIERQSKLRMYHTLKKETKHKGFKND
jgi:hypothetical protein